MKRKFRRKFSYDYKVRILLTIFFAVMGTLALEFRAYPFVFLCGFGSLIFLSMAESMPKNEKYK